ncbi:MAG: YdcF family protein [Actinobacteria bacterium]|nr:YdcF family protein [Actinomycetota bacterium]
MLGKSLRFVALLVCVAGLCIALTTFEVWRVGRSSTTTEVDAIVVMGAAQYDGRPSPQLAARLDHVVELWKLGVASRVIVTGGNQPGDRFTESSASRDYLVERGVTDAAVAEESKSRSTWEAFANLRSLVESSVLDTKTRSILVVTDPFHSLRSRLIAEENGFDAATSATSTSPVDGSSALTKHVKEGIGVAVGRIIGFRWLWKVTG